jgi:signal transduction histidine kinase
MQDTALCRCIGDQHVKSRLYFDVATEDVVATTSIPAHELEQFWSRLDVQPFARLTNGWGVSWFVVSDGTDASIFSVLAEVDPELKPLRGFAFQLRPEGVGEMARLLYDAHPLLFGASPNALPNSELFDVTLRTPRGQPVFATNSAASTEVRTERQLRDVTGSLVVALALKATAPDLLIPGGMPRPRLPYLLVLLAITGAAVVAALFVLRREAELMRMRSDFVSSVSHELRTPLAQIRMFTETLLLGRVRSDIERRRALEIIDQEARRLAQLVENVLTFGRGAQRRARVAPQPTSFTEEVQHIVDSFAGLRNAQEADLRLELQDDIVVPVDRDALRQILLNLVDNALKYGPTGQRVTIGTALFGDAARVWVDDEGPGVPPKERERVFESFQRLSRELERSVTGSGIGLSVVRELTRLHGGTTWIEDAPGGGTRVVAEFPGAYVRGAESAEGWAVA